MSSNENCNEVIDAIGRIIGQNADWLDGRLFQKLALIAARANYEDDDLDDYLNAEEALKAFEAASKMVLKAATE